MADLTQPFHVGSLIDYSTLSSYADSKAESVQHPKGKLTARERIALLCDEGSFIEHGRFFGGDPAQGFLGSAAVTGFGSVAGRPVAVYAQDFSVKGGTLGRVEGEKITSLINSAIEQGVPCFSLLDSGGARIQEGVGGLAMYGRIFRASCRASGYIPQISLILGPCAGGAVYSPALTDFVIMTERNSHMFITGPDVVRAVTGEEVSLDDLGGAKMHGAVSGVAHYLAQDERDALDYARSLLSYLPQNCNSKQDPYTYIPPYQDEESARNVGEFVPQDSRIPYDVTEVIKALVDHGEFVETHEHWAKSAVTGFSCIDGRPIGIVANQPLHNAGTLDVESSEKIARFVRCCDAFGLPVVTLVDVPGYLPGVEQERAGIIRRGAKVIHAYGNSTVPLITIITRKAYGGAYIVMGSKGIGADRTYAWPKAEIAVMGAEGAVQILKKRDLESAPKKHRAAIAQKLSKEYAAQHINPNLSVQMGELDGVISPSETRSAITTALSQLTTKNRKDGRLKYHSNSPL
ncbi:acyl-CoA carboxylase subunit beta [Corynebacterium kefirresidentii]|uniref:acyl-CoA carboxylase subunit beta n=1 Tax=Corynebacterium kefirresidentii TaxID=1979527 RepID=UPI00264BC62C|nr:acyl-CoA carboxylase subunit beta [Corynebacterium kefirresidentii]MDN8634746.1 acyl-CoA carboxylase subunit beta [Corynebacterium kefirresidentii]